MRQYTRGLKNEMSVSRRFALSARFYFEFKNMFEK